MSSKRRRREIEELEKRLHTANKSQNFNEQSDIQLELADLFKEDNSENAIGYYESALKSSKRAHNYRNTILAYRNLGEIHISLAETDEDYRQGFRYLKQQLEYAEQAKDHGLAQLAFHTLSQSYAGESQNFGCESINLTKALFYGRGCLNYLNKYKHEIDEDKKAIRTDANSGRRCAGINSVLADIYIKIGATKKALDHIGASIDYALKNNIESEPLFLYQCYFVKLELMRETACLELIERMRTHANKNKIKENRDILERKYYMYLLTCHPTESSKLCDVVDYFLKQHESRDTTDIDYVNNVLKFLHLLVDLEQHLSATVTNRDRSQLYENLGDQACNAEFFEFGMDYYRKMLYYAEKDQNKERIYLACGSIAETARNLHDYKEAKRYQERALILARDLYADDQDKIFFDECDLFYLDVRNGYNDTANKDVQYQRFLAILQTSDTNRKKSAVLDEFVLFLAYYGYKNELQRWSQELETSNRLKETEPSLASYEEEALPKLTSSDRYSLREFVLNSRDKKAREDVSWKNIKGETRLHEAAKIDDPNEVRKLIESGQDVNARDHAGWTPLQEAVSYGHLNNVRILCQSGADLNVASSEGLVDDDGNVGPSGITPIMDACASGKVQIARVLMRLGSDLSLRNENNETAADLLRNYIETNRTQVSDREIVQCEALLTDLEKRGKKRSAQTSPPRDKFDTSQEKIKQFCFGHNFSP